MNREQAARINPYVLDASSAMDRASRAFANGVLAKCD